MSVLSLFLAGTALAEDDEDKVMRDLPARAGSVSAVVNLKKTDIPIAPSDELAIDVFQVEELSGVRKVNSRGEIRMPLIGSVKVAGLTVEQAEELLRELLGAQYLVDPEVNIDISGYASQEVTVLGSVANPGVYQLEGPTTLLQVMAMAGGTENLAAREQVIVFRRAEGGGVIGYVVNFKAVFKGELQDPRVAGNDRIVVPESGGKGLYSDITRTLRGFVRFETYDFGLQE